MCVEKSRRGRPRIYDSDAAKKRAFRARAIQAGCKEIHVALPEEYKTLFGHFCAENKMSQAEAFCYLLDLHFDFPDSTPTTQMISLPEEYKTRLDTFCTENKLSLAEAVCYLLDLQSGFSDSTSPTQIKK